ncbi:hypothetical protein V8G54_007769 [Vigna mungo]|uniref:Uncharacterized protein n=1 Tax=Vigna mungo TaxID=3915 RepID=A0AAQ3S7L6_VIGMU
MAEAVMGFTLFKSHNLGSSLQTRSCFSLLQHSNSTLFSNRPWQKVSEGQSKRASLCKVNGLPDWPLMAVIVEHMEGQRDLITTKTVSHLSDQAIKNVYTWYIMFTVWGGLFFGSMKQEMMEAEAREALWREELIEEIEEKVEGLRELEEGAKKEELVK